MPEQEIPMSQRSEEDIKRLYVTPALEAKWDKNKITMETRITDGKINLQGNLVVREAGKKADYFLYTTVNKPIAVVEAKKATKPVGEGMQQAIEYATMQGLKFAYSTNGKEFLEHDFITGKERTFSMDAFPTEEELLARLKGANVITDAELKIAEQPFYTGQNSYPPRYYQQRAVNAITEAVARGQKRVLIVMATGTGKTYVAFQTIYRLLKAGLIKRVLYLADRNVLIDQSLDQDFRPLAKVCHKIQVAKDNKNKLTSYNVNFALYQQLVGDNGEKHYEKLFKPDYFDLIIIDECHRGSAKADSAWREILEYFQPAYQVGMTAT
ncbi:MAG: DEAD/DEAH box helicase family protein, partial [Phascolarctobacterium sp.]|nr:DEAD/DEAH box helicase family protein [Candidatus Phascolarctobacterium equi]